MSNVTASAWGYIPLWNGSGKKKVAISEDKHSLNECLEYFNLTPKCFSVLEKGEQAVVVCDVNVEATITWKQGDRYYSKTFQIQKGFTFDGASIPPVFWDLVGEPTDSDFLIAAMIHDYLYSIRFNRKISDGAFRTFLIQNGVWTLKAKLMWAGVRLGGFVFYAGDTSKFWKKVRNYL